MSFLSELVFKLRLVAVLSSLGLFAAMAQAHEIQPSIADLTVTDGQMVFDLRLNAEAFVAEIDLSDAHDTDLTDQAERYDALRVLEPDEMAARLRAFAESWAPRIAVDADGPVALQVSDVVVPETGDLALPRASRLVLTGAVPASARTLDLTWPADGGALVLRQQGVEAPFTGLIEAGASTGPIALAGGNAATGWQTFVGYIPVGFDHILPKGLDHILFVLGLFFLSTRLRPLIWQVSAFTLAHTVTLALGALGWVNVPGSIVEPLIAASITYVAVENIFSKGLSRWRPAVIFGFGLLHGLGFASVLGEFGLPQDQFIPALIGFNIGVELGQLTVIAAAFLAVGYWFGSKPWYRKAISIPASVAIAAVGAYWVVERVFL